MAICQNCKQEMRKASKCTKPLLVVKYRAGSVFVFKRDTEYYDANKRCHDCGIANRRGNVHHLGCDVERCPNCGLQLISCSCLDDAEYYPADIGDITSKRSL